MCPIYSYECPRGHKFDKIVPIALMDEYQECPGECAEPRRGRPPTPGWPFVIVPCRAPAKRIPVPSQPAHFIMH